MPPEDATPERAQLIAEILAYFLPEDATGAEVLALLEDDRMFAELADDID